MVANKIALIGFGEAARAFAEGWGSMRPSNLAVSDLRHDQEIQDAATSHGASFSSNKAEALADAQVVFCLVTADKSLNAAKQSAPFLSPGVLWLDGNSCAPDTKKRAGAIIEAAGGAYVDMAIMAPVHPKKHRVPILLSGPHALEAQQVLATLGMSGAVMGLEIGRASIIKMLRSVMIKGLEALSAECFLAARAAGVEAEVLSSLQASDPGFNWAARGAYNLERMIVHGGRRAAEMNEVAQTVADLGLSPDMSRATLEWQARIAALKLNPGEDNLGERANSILGGLKSLGN
ncbi:DUF1932 domain-containing protein [Thioclava sp. FR2]|uniref:NAD(P)-dependent oxidoreductase n=1 Tax=Thioclava sp. FR2 TaxID=3445780 RepID=UPI003EBF7FB3